MLNLLSINFIIGCNKIHLLYKLRDTTACMVCQPSLDLQPLSPALFVGPISFAPFGLRLMTLYDSFVVNLFID